MAKRCLGQGGSRGWGAGVRCHIALAQGPPLYPEHPHAWTRSLQHPATEGPRGPRTPRMQGWVMVGRNVPVPTGRSGTPRYSRWVLAQGSAFVLQHLLRPVDVVEPVRVHRHQDAADVGLRESEVWGCERSEGDDPPKNPTATVFGGMLCVPKLT